MQASCCNLRPSIMRRFRRPLHVDIRSWKHRMSLVVYPKEVESTGTYAEVGYIVDQWGVCDLACDGIETNTEEFWLGKPIYIDLRICYKMPLSSLE